MTANFQSHLEPNGERSLIVPPLEPLLAAAQDSLYTAEKDWLQERAALSIVMTPLLQHAAPETTQQLLGGMLSQKESWGESAPEERSRQNVLLKRST